MKKATRPRGAHMRVVRPIAFDANRKARRNAKAREARKRRETKRNYLAKFIWRLTHEPWDMFLRDTANDNVRGAGGKESQRGGRPQEWRP
jgi:hypothetical protein